MSRIWQNPNTSLINFDSVVNSQGIIDKKMLRSYISKETGLDDACKFLTDYQGAIDFEFECAEDKIDLDPDTFIAAIRNQLLINANTDNFRHFQFKKQPNARDPFQLPESQFQEFFNRVEVATAGCMSFSGVAIFGTAGTGIGIPVAAIALFAMFVLSPFFLLANRAGHLASIANRMNLRAAASTWLATLAPTVPLTYLIYHNLFKLLNDHFKNINSNGRELFICHVICAYITALVFAVNVAFAGKVTEKCQIDARYPSDKFRRLLAKMNSEGATKPDGTQLAEKQKETLSNALSDTNFAKFLIESKAKGAEYEKAAQIIMEVHLKSIEIKSNLLDPHQVRVLSTLQQ